MTVKHDMSDKKKIPSEYLVSLVSLAHSVLQNDKDLCYGVNYDWDFHTIYKNNSPIISYGGIWSQRKEYWPEFIRIYAPLGQQIHHDLNYEIRLSNSSRFGHVSSDFFSLTYYPDQCGGVAYGAIPDSECEKIKSEIFNIANSRGSH